MNTIFDASRFFKDYNINHATSGNKHCSPGWIHIHCPFCKSNNYHLGFNIISGAWNCWRCGKHGLYSILKELLGYNQNINEIIKRYQGNIKQVYETRIRPSADKKLLFPAGIIESIPERAKQYLISRKFDHELLERIWKLKYTGPLGDYKFRIIAPIYSNGKLQSYQGRDYTGKSKLRYKACRKENEAQSHQELLYGEWLIKRNTTLIVEGIADAWRMGPGALATFGMAFTDSQILKMCSYKRLFILFDGEEKAIKQAYKLAGILRSLKKVEVHIIELESGDPGEMDQDEADYLMKDIGL